MVPPLVSYITHNRLGLTARNLTALLSTPEDFEMHIVDSNSKDDTWEFIQDLKDSRIKSKTRLPVNSGPIYAVNMNLAKRRSDQYFVAIDSDVHVKTSNWFTRFMEVFNTFPEVGLLGVMRGKPYPQLYPQVVLKSKDGVSYLELKYGRPGEILDFVHGCFQCLRPELIREIGYWSEESGWGDAELSPRVNNYTSFKAGFMTGLDFESLIDIDMTQWIGCDECSAQEYCHLDRGETTCFTIKNKNYKNESFVNMSEWKYREAFKELEEGKRTAYCASILDVASLGKHLYHADWAFENFNYYIENSN